jgi:hypothetical protein
MRAAIIGAAIAAVSLSGCATKRYPIATKLGPAEQSTMTCPELELELARAEMVRMRISDAAETDWRSIAGFIGDAGIGNFLAKKDAEKAIDARVASILAAQAAKHCSGGPSASLEEELTPLFTPGAA